MIKKFKTVIILVNYNGFEDTRECIKSITDVIGELPHIVLVDNNSKDLENLKTLYQLYDKLHIIFNDENIGFGRANNVGIKWAQENIEFEYLLLLNNDTLMEPNTIGQLIKPFSKDPKIGITTGKIMYEANRDLVWYGGGQIDYNRGWPKIQDYNNTATSKGANLSKYVDFISGCVMMFTKESIKRIRGFDDEFFMYCEDLELCMRTRKLGYKLYYEPKSIVYHKVQGATKTSKKGPSGLHPRNSNIPFLFFHMKTNQWLANRKHLETYDFYRFNLFFWSEFAYKIVVYILYGNWKMIGVGFSIIKNIANSQNNYTS